MTSEAVDGTGVHERVLVRERGVVKRSHTHMISRIGREEVVVCVRVRRMVRSRRSHSRGAKGERGDVSVTVLS